MMGLMRGSFARDVRLQRPTRYSWRHARITAWLRRHFILGVSIRLERSKMVVVQHLGKDLRIEIDYYQYYEFVLESR